MNRRLLRRVAIVVGFALSALLIMGLLFEWFGSDHPSHGRVAFTSNRDIYVERASSSKAIRMTNGSGTNAQPSWSPDTTRIAFVSNRHNPQTGSQKPVENFQVYVMNADGSNQVQLSDIPKGCVLPAWSPDGKRIACVFGVFIYIIDVEAGDFFELTGHDPWPPSHPVELRTTEPGPSWSPDGRRLVYALGKAILIGDVETHQNVEVARALPGWVPAAPVWSPDGSRIAFVSGPEIHIVDAGGANDRAIANGFSPSWSSDGTRVAFIDTATPEGGTRNGRVYVVNADGSFPIERSAGLKVNRDGTGASFYLRPVWSPDDSEVAFEFQSNQEPGFFSNDGLYAGRSDGSGTYRLTEKGGSIFGYWWASWTGS